MRNAAKLLAASFVLFALASPVHAQVYVSTNGNDSLPCTQTNPCRNLWRALNVVAAGGQIWVMDSGNFSTGVTVNVTKSVSIRGLPGAIASVAASGNTPALQINAPGAVVALRNMTFTDQGGISPGQDGVAVTDAGTVFIEDCLFADTRRDAVHLAISNVVVHISNTTFRNVAGWAVYATDGPTVDINRSRLLHTGGVYAFAEGIPSVGFRPTTSVSISDTTISDGPMGVSAQAGGFGGVAQAFVTRSTIFGTADALDSESPFDSTSLITVSNSSITHNQNAFNAVNSGIVKSLGNNYIADNAAEQGSLTAIPLR
jgi:Right handed beta helix region